MSRMTFIKLACPEKYRLHRVDGHGKLDVRHDVAMVLLRGMLHDSWGMQCSQPIPDNPCQSHHIPTFRSHYLADSHKLLS
jgi:hypothetical protein